MSTAIVYVQLGDNPSKTLSTFARNAQALLENSNSILLTDLPEKWLDFPGKLVDISNFQYAPGYLKFEKANRELKKIAGGYWLNTLKRLFALEILSTIPEISGDILHFESDVFSFVTQPVIEALRENVTTAAVPRFSKEKGIASILYVRDRKAIESLIKRLSDILQNNPTIRDDMELLGSALNNGQIQELPTLPIDAWAHKAQKYIFDGAAYGQYIFGQDPFHTDGKIISGYKNPDFDFDAGNAHWSARNVEGMSTLTFKFENENYDLANLHIHSKLVLDPISEQNQIWAEYLSQANGESQRLAIQESENSIHSQKLTIMTRLMVARKKGLIRTSINKLNRILNN